MNPQPDIKLRECHFETKFAKTDGCWIWQGTKTNRGYGRYGKRLAHRLSYEKYVGKIPEGLTIDHLCNVPSCVNPSHLEPKTHKENNLRGNSPAAKNARKTHCSKGHDLSQAKIVVRVDGVRRNCMICHLAQKRVANKRRIKQTLLTLQQHLGKE